jgi:ACS family sodium-dependent inorganic phosphate cotransporter
LLKIFKTNFLSISVATRVGGNYVFGVGVGMTALLTLFTPFATKLSVGCLIAIRVIQGFFSGVAFPSIYDVFAKWAPPQERSRITTFTFTGNYAGTVITMPLGGFLAAYFGWESVFYFFGAVALFWFFIWMLCISRSPAEDKWINEKEKQYILKSFARNKGSQRPKNLPWKEIFSSPAVWAIVAAQFAELWAFYTMLTQLPTFLMDTMEFDLGKTGIISALPYLAMAIMLSTGGYVADLLQNKGILTTTQVRKYLNCGAFVAKAIFMTLGAYVLQPAFTITCIILSVGFGGVGWCGWSVNLLDIAPQFAGVLMGITNTFGTLAGIVAPQVTGYLTQNHLGSEWQLVFYIASVVTIIGGIIYWFLATGEVQPWAIHQDKLGDVNTASSLEETEMTQLNTPEKGKTID